MWWAARSAVMYKSIVTLKPYQTLKERSTPKLDAEDKKVYKIGMHEDGDN